MLITKFSLFYNAIYSTHIWSWLLCNRFLCEFCGLAIGSNSYRSLDAVGSSSIGTKAYLPLDFAGCRLIDSTESVLCSRRLCDRTKWPCLAAISCTKRCCSLWIWWWAKPVGFGPGFGGRLRLVLRFGGATLNTDRFSLKDLKWASFLRIFAGGV